MASIELILGDCLEKMTAIESGSIDMVLTDPPYGTTSCRWDSVISFEPMWEQLNRLIRPRGAILLFGSEPFSSALRMSNIQNYKYDWVWDKHIPRNFINAKRMPMNRYENISVFKGSYKGTINYYPIMTKRDKPVTTKNYARKGKDSAYRLNIDGTDGEFKTYTHRYPVNIISGLWESNTGKLHPTQKPVSLIEYLIKTYTIVDETVLDFAFGSGTTGIACSNLDRNFKGIEINVDNFRIAEKRIGAI